MKIDPTKMIETEIRWLVNYECTTSWGKVFLYYFCPVFVKPVGPQSQ